MLFQNSITGRRTKIGYPSGEKTTLKCHGGQGAKGPQGPQTTDSSAMPFPTAVIMHEALAAGWL